VHATHAAVVGVLPGAGGTAVGTTAGVFSGDGIDLDLSATLLDSTSVAVPDCAGPAADIHDDQFNVSSDNTCGFTNAQGSLTGVGALANLLPPVLDEPTVAVPTVRPLLTDTALGKQIARLVPTSSGLCSGPLYGTDQVGNARPGFGGPNSCAAGPFEPPADNTGGSGGGTGAGAGRSPGTEPSTHQDFCGAITTRPTC